MQTIKTEKQEVLFIGLSKIPLKKSIPVPTHLKSLKKSLSDFQEELDFNILNSMSAKEILDYLSKLKISFLDSLMYYEGSFELLLFPDDIECVTENTQRISNFKKANLLIYRMAIQFINKTIERIKYAFENNILLENFIQLSKYVIVDKTCKAIDIVELGYALFYTGFFINRTGEGLQLHDFIENLGRFFGIEIINMRQRIQELKKRVKTSVVFLKQLLNSILNNIFNEK